MFGPQDQIENIRRRCISCGRCRLVCPVFESGEFDPMELMAVGEGDVSKCLLCGKCSKTCRRSDPFKVITLTRQIEGIQ